MSTHEDDPLRVLVESGLTYAEAEAAYALAGQSADYRTVLREMSLRGDMRLTANQRRHLATCQHRWTKGMLRPAQCISCGARRA